MRRVVGSRAVLVVTGVIVLGVGGLFFALGLDDADKLGSVLAALAALAGLGLTVTGALRGGGTNPDGTNADGVTVHGSAVGGSVAQVDRVGGSVRLGGSRPADGRAPRDVPEPADGTAAGGLSVRGSTVDGDVFQAKSVDGDVETHSE
ncbi:hypothetical protein BJF79_04875 [Actinomadura sp. CNU-125]|uniref:hypothetical protein n=1 Tax=Actinomadura sp. CNU-125 TaxID=1904961 RepID=UPI00095EF93E|nr:hypothetical protein [Actinomadura sp. CNU-125]OLT10066.1 hypothetical protein BJF79_04875 [Actinomadura sp. CNU-125]